MQLSKVVRLVWTFYRGFMPVSLIITGSCIWIFWRGGYSVFAVLFWYKVITTALIYCFINSYKKREYYYYQNLGLSKRKLWALSLAFDFSLFILLIIVACQLK